MGVQAKQLKDNWVFANPDRLNECVEGLRVKVADGMYTLGKLMLTNDEPAFALMQEAYALAQEGVQASQATLAEADASAHDKGEAHNNTISATR